MKAQRWLLAALVVGSAGAQAGTGQHEFNSEVQQALVAICADTLDDNRLALKKTLKAHRISVGTAVDKVVCNGQPLPAFARAVRAHKVMRYLAPYDRGHVDIKDLAAPN